MPERATYPTFPAATSMLSVAVCNFHSGLDRAHCCQRRDGSQPGSEPHLPPTLRAESRPWAASMPTAGQKVVQSRNVF